MTRRKARRLPGTIMNAKRVDRCEECDSPLRWKTSTRAKPHDLPDYGFAVKVSGMATATCSRCRTAHAVVPNVARLRESIVEQVLARPGALSADEIVFMRKHLKMTGGKFASLVGVSREHISHIEQGHAPSLGTAADRLARMMIAAKTDPSLKLLKKLMAQLDEDIGTRSRRKMVRHGAYRVTLPSRR
jgi:DNA-binding transcriptional regulator YiaG